jgi:hypothetical protein
VPGRIARRLIATCLFVERLADGSCALIGAQPREGLRARVVRPLFSVG